MDSLHIFFYMLYLFCVSFNHVFCTTIFEGLSLILLVMLNQPELECLTTYGDLTCEPSWCENLGSAF